MTPRTIPDRRAQVRDWCGAEPTDQEIDAAVARHADDPTSADRVIQRAAATVLRGRLADLTRAGAGPAELAAVGRKLRAIERELGDTLSDLPLVSITA